MTSTERIFEYANMPSEPDNGKNTDLRPTWPEEGQISCKGASFSYDPSLANVLKKLYFDIKPMEKVIYRNGLFSN